ncbi:MAG: ABC transporter substrate-binding protein [Paracoccaceae bacterium]|nr:MAG: ABC transporter substrate-binding protein [Paracoccaceae bacterium]
MTTHKTWRHFAFCVSLALLAGPALAAGHDTTGIPADPDLAARVPDRIRQAGVLVGAADNAYAPWEYLAGADGQTPEGIDIDLGNAIAAKWGLKYESRTAVFETILPALGAKYDIGLNAFTITNERMKAVNFVSYYRGQRRWLVRAGNPTGFDPFNACGAVVAIHSGTSQEKVVIKLSDECVAAGKAAIQMLPFKSQPEAQTRVAAGGADATIAGGAQVNWAAKQANGALESIGFEHPDYPPGQNGIAVAKSDMELTQLVADTVNELIADGTYGKIMEAWGQPTDFGPAEVNPTVVQ